MMYCPNCGIGVLLQVITTKGPVDECDVCFFRPESTPEVRSPAPVPECKGDFGLGTACGKCERCKIMAVAIVEKLPRPLASPDGIAKLEALLNKASDINDSLQSQVEMQNPTWATHQQLDDLLDEVLTMLAVRK